MAGISRPFFYHYCVIITDSTCLLLFFYIISLFTFSLLSRILFPLFKEASEDIDYEKDIDDIPGLQGQIV